MAADLPTSLASWSTSVPSNLPLGSTTITNLAENLRTMQSVVRYLASADTIASSTICDLGSKESAFLTVSGTTTITGLGTISAGIYKFVTFSGALILTHSGVGLILPTAANITTAAGDTAMFVSLGSGFWKCILFTRANGQSLVSVASINDGTVSAPGLYFLSDTDTGMYRIGTNNMGFTCGGTKVLDVATGAVVLTGSLTVTNGATIGGGLTSSNGFSSTSGTATLTATTNIFTWAAAGSTAVQAVGNWTHTMQAGAYQIDLDKTNGLGFFKVDGTNGNSIYLYAGAASATAPSGGGIQIYAGSSAQAGSAGGVDIRGGTHSSGGSGQLPGPVAISAGDYAFVGPSIVGIAGANVTITAGGVSGAAAIPAGDVIIKPGNQSSSGLSGAVRMQMASGVDLLVASAAKQTVTFGGQVMGGAISGAGAGPSIVGNNQVFRLTCGTTPTTTITINPTAPVSGNVWANAPVCIVQYETGNIACRASCTTTSITITLASAPANGSVISGHIFAYE